MHDKFHDLSFRHQVHLIDFYNLIPGDDCADVTRFLGPRPRPATMTRATPRPAAVRIKGVGKMEHYLSQKMINNIRHKEQPQKTYDNNALEKL